MVLFVEIALILYWLLVAIVVAFNLLLCIAGYFFGRGGILMCGLTATAMLIVLAFSIERACDRAGMQPDQSFEGCGNVIGFHLWILSGLVLPVLVLPAVVLTLVAILELRSQRRHDEDAEPDATGN